MGLIGVGAATAALSLASGFLFARFGGGGFWVMAALAGLALPLVFALPAKSATGRDPRRKC